MTVIPCLISSGLARWPRVTLVDGRGVRFTPWSTDVEALRQPVEELSPGEALAIALQAAAGLAGLVDRRRFHVTEVDVHGQIRRLAGYDTEADAVAAVVLNRNNFFRQFNIDLVLYFLL